MSKTYILLKSLPDNSVGDVFEYSDRTGYYEHGGTKFLPRVVEGNSEWFTPFYKKEDRKYTKEDMRKAFTTSEFSWRSFESFLTYIKPNSQPPPHK